MTAKLTDLVTGAELLRSMYFVARVAMNQHSLMIEGKVAVADRESAKSKTTKHTVRWLCKVPRAPAMLNPKLPRAQHQQVIRDVQRNPFHPFFDDAEEPTYGPMEE